MKKITLFSLFFLPVSIAERNIICRKVLILVFIFLILALSESFAQWEPDMRLTFDSASSTYPSVATDGTGRIHVVWRDTRDGIQQIYYKRSTDGGTTWGSDIKLTNLTVDPGSWIYGSIATNGGDTVHMVWFDNRTDNFEIYYRRSIDGGASWESEVRLTNDPGVSFFANIASTPTGSLHVVWHDSRDGNYEIYYKRSTDGGTTWESDVRLTDNPSFSGRPFIAVEGSFVCVVWFDERDGNTEIYYKQSADGGATWGPDVRLTNDPSSSQLSYPNARCVAVFGSLVYVVWHDGRDGNNEIYYKRSTDGGITWQTDTRLTSNDATSKDPSVAADNTGGVHVVWSDGRDPYDEIYYKLSADSGGTWGPDIRLTFNPQYSQFPCIAVGSLDRLHVVWHDDRDGNYEIYYKRNSTEGIETPSFAAFSSSNYIKLKWEFSLENDVIQYVIYRKSEGKQRGYFEIARIQGPGSSPSPQNYSYKDKDVKIGVRYYYKLGVVTTNGSTRWYGPVSAMVTGTKPFLSVSPNPFTERVKISFVGVSGNQSIGEQEINIYDVSGRRVKRFTINDSRLTNVIWDGKNDNGEMLPSGIYYCRLTHGSLMKTENVLLVK